MTAVELITKDDLVNFKAELLADLKDLLKPEDMISRKWLKGNEVRKLLNISPGTLQNLRINKTLPFTRIGSIIFYKQQDIYALLEGGRK
ncbi:helix-turn-helix domain-containing protein [Pedobacter aquatilis]|uniref:helix-turn-helix domain-containing protein n=1 Tax=Pedobacter aquatilis TaxID=351343 RepID=UPI002930CC77|nr:helix-turn-helix domain-containing protein [Pedobacter aquatilis]